MLRGLPSLGRLGWALIGGMIVLIAALSVWPEPIPYPGMIVPASAIRAREVPFTPPGPWDRTNVQTGQREILACFYAPQADV